MAVPGEAMRRAAATNYPLTSCPRFTTIKPEGPTPEIWTSVTSVSSSYGASLAAGGEGAPGPKHPLPCGGAPEEAGG